MKQEEVVSELLNHITETFPMAKAYGTLPLDRSLVEIGVLDSFAVIELVEFIERHWKIEIQNSELTREKFGSINKMANLIVEKKN